ncbi:MAG: hypothetical protein B7X41_01820 [Microbacterium sp. 14-71-5]|nr:MAG: hypothetical protein B7X41_01820 [Microbacterium sp. 14-71-5]
MLGGDIAQAPGGLSCFLLPRALPDGSRNPFLIQRLKDKLGNRANASSEVEFDATVAWLVGEEGRGVRTIIEMVNQTRLDCMLGTAAGMRQATAEAIWHAQHRAAFGALLAEQPAMTQVLADLAVETEAAIASSLRVAAAYEADAPAADEPFRRLATAVLKYWICKRGPGHAYEALECLGGNGYTEAFPLARRYREQPVMAVWEGSGNVIALDVLRAIAREPETADALLAEVRLAEGADARLDAHLADTERLLREAQRDPASAEAQAGARRLTEALAVALPVGIASGLAMSWLVIGALDLRGFTGGEAAPALSLPPGWLAVAVLGFAGVTAVAVLLATAAAMRLRSAEAIRVADDEG